MDKNKDIKEISVADNKLVQDLNVQQESILKDAADYLEIEQKLRAKSSTSETSTQEPITPKKDVSSVEKTDTTDSINNKKTESEKIMDQNDKNKPTENSVKVAEANNTTTEHNHKPQNTSYAPKSNLALGLSTAILAIAITAIAVYGYQELDNLKQENLNYTNATYELNKANDLLNKSLADNKILQAQIESLSNENLVLQQDNKDLIAKYEQNTQLLEQNNLDIKAIASRIDKYESRDPNDWILAKAYYLISSAYHSTINSSDLEAAIFELKTAQNLISHIKSKNIVELRTALGADINMLENLKPIDITAITIKLNDLYHNVELLTFAQPEALFDENSTDNTTNDTTSWYNNALKSLATFSARFVEIKKRSDNSLDEFLNPKEGALIKENIKLTLNIIKANLTNHNDEAFKDNLDLILSLLDLYFDKNNEIFTNMEKDLLELRKMNISYNVQNQLQSYEKINVIIAKQIKNLNLGANND